MAGGNLFQSVVAVTAKLCSPMHLLGLVKETEKLVAKVVNGKAVYLVVFWFCDKSSNQL